MSRQPDPASFAQRIQRMTEGQTIYVPLEDIQRQSIHVTLSRLRREYSETFGGEELPCWHLDIPEEPGDLWAITYLGLTVGGRIPFTNTTPEERAARRRELQRAYRKRRTARYFDLLVEHSRQDLRLREDAPLGYEPVTGDMVAEGEELQRKSKEQASILHQRRLEKRERERAESQDQPPKPSRAKFSDSNCLQPDADIAAKPMSLMQLEDEQARLFAAINYATIRLEQNEAQLDIARTSYEKAKPPEFLSPRQYARLQSGESQSRQARALARIKKHKERIQYYEDRIEDLEDQRDTIKQLIWLRKNPEMLQRDNTESTI